jgi:hypothetical protein
MRLRQLIEVQGLKVDAAATGGVGHATVLRRIREAGIERQFARPIFRDREWLLAREENSVSAFADVISIDR